MRIVLLLWLGLPLMGQTLELYSEFRRVDSKGKILKQDLGGRPREILSPGLARNAFHSFRLALRFPKNQHYTLWITQNPDGLKTTLYREVHDRLTIEKNPVEALGTGETETFWLDAFVPALAPVRRIRLEPQLHDGVGWVTYPMEVRVLAAIVPQLQPSGAAPPPVTEPADAPARQVLQEYLCGGAVKHASAGMTARDLIRRNALQDVALARALEGKWGKDKLADAIAKAAGGESAAGWCAAGKTRPPNGPEWYLRVRDFLYREGSR